MFSKTTPPWITLGGFGLACMAGGINAVGFLGMHHQAISHMSGTVTVLSNELATGRFSLAIYAAGVVISFFVGSVLSAAILREISLKLGRRYGVVLVIESLLLFVACRMLIAGNFAGDCVAAMACGLQNAMATHYSGAVIRTTHVTGLITDIGIAIGLRLRGIPIDVRRIRLHLVLLFGFFSGGMMGSLGYTQIGFSALMIPATLSGLAGVAYFAFKHWHRNVKTAV